MAFTWAPRLAKSAAMVRTEESFNGMAGEGAQALPFQLPFAQECKHASKHTPDRMEGATTMSDLECLSTREVLALTLKRGLLAGAMALLSFMVFWFIFIMVAAIL